MKTNSIDFETLKQATSLAEVITDYARVDTLKRIGHKLIGPCPIHGGNNPRAFHADVDKGVWYCFTKCGRGGGMLDFIACKENISIAEAGRRLHAYLGEAVPSARAITTPQTPRRVLKTHKTQPLLSNKLLQFKLTVQPDHPYLTETRLLRPETIKYFDVGVCHHGIMKHCVAIPIHNQDGDLVAYAGRRLEKQSAEQYGKYKFPTGFRKELELFNHHRIKPRLKTAGVVVVEGFFSAMRLHQLGITNVVALMGCVMSQRQAAKLIHAKTITLLFDGDAAGQAGRQRACQLLAKHPRVHPIILPPSFEPEDLEPGRLRAICG